MSGSCQDRKVFLSLREDQSSTCGEKEDVNNVHILLSGVVQVRHELLVGQEEERKRNRDGRKRGE